MKPMSGSRPMSLSDRRRHSFKIQLPPPALAVREVAQALADMRIEETDETEAREDDYSRPLMSCKDRVPTPFNFHKADWVDEADVLNASAEVEEPLEAKETQPAPKSVKERASTLLSPFMQWLN